VLITYFDEVKYHKGRQPYYWLGGITVDAEAIKTLEDQLNSLAEEVFGVRTLSRDTEFHAADIMNGHEQFEGWKWEKKLSVLKRLISIFGSAQNMGKIYVRIEPARMVGSDVEGTAFMYFIERVDGYLRAQQAPGLLIGDRESESISGKFAESLSSYRASGTSYRFGKELKYLVDTVHFTHSHHSRMLQLADMHIWLRQLCCNGDKGKWHRKQIIEHVRSITDCLHAHRYKIWPTADSWTKVATAS
jgi:hypothetical protein